MHWARTTSKENTISASTLKRGLFAGLATTAVGLGIAAPAFAGTITSPSTNPVVVANNPTTGQIVEQSFTASGFSPGLTVYAEICDGVSPSTPGYQTVVDCDYDGTGPGKIVPASGTVTFPANDINYGIPFVHGEDAADTFNCLAPGDNPNGTTTVSGGYPIDNTDPSWGASTVGISGGGTANCQVRIAYNAATPASTDAYVSYQLQTNSGPGTTVPESPLAIILPIGAVVLLTAGGFVMTRRRRSTHVAS